MMKQGILFEAVAVLLLVFLTFVLYVMVTTGPSAEQWTLSGLTVSSNLGSSMYIGPGNMLYAVSGNSVNAVSPEGRLLHQTKIPDLLNSGSSDWVGYQASFDDNTEYFLVTPILPISGFVPMYGGIELLAISDTGRLLWSKVLNSNMHDNDTRNLNIKAGDGKVYLHAGMNEMVYGRNGNLLYHLGNIYLIPALDEKGNLYTVPGEYSYGYVEAYGPNGSLKWRYDLGIDAFAEHDIYGLDEPVYSDHTVFVQLNKGLMALNDDGSLRWKKTFNASYVYMDQQPDGNWYVHNMYYTDNGTDYNISYITIVRPDGSETVAAEKNLPADIFGPMMANGTIYYAEKTDGAAGIKALDDPLRPWQVNAYDMVTGNKLWTYTVRPEKTINSTLNESTIASVMYWNYGGPDDIIQMNRITPAMWYYDNSLPFGYEEVRNSSNVRLIPWNGGVYVEYWGYNYEYPFFFDQSRCVYGGGMYALDKNGTLLWEAPTSSEINTIVVNNSTVYYSTRAGKLSAFSGNAAAGMALTAAFYLFIRFFLAGAVTRARGRIDSNENRNRILKFIADNPGASLYDISRDIKLNMGTVRYHLMILGINHRITSYKADDKYVRYFSNAGSYSREQQFIVSMMKRDGIKKVLNALIEKPGLSNIELSMELGLHESAASRYMRELLEKGIVEKGQMGDGRLSYSIKNEYKEPVSFAIKRLGDSIHRA